MIFTFFLVAMLVACTAPEKLAPAPEKLPLALTPAAFADLPGWERDDHGAALAAFAVSCERIARRDPADPFGPEPVGGAYGDWQPACRALQGVSPAGARVFFETWFTPHLAGRAGDADGATGLFTGYYEPLLRGAAAREAPFIHPLYARPDDLVMVDLGEFREELKGQRVAGRVQGAHLKPYEDRAAIEAGDWPHNDKALLWVDDAIDSFFLHIQGSGRVQMPDGTVVRVGYDGQNGHVYYAIGRDLIRRGEIAKEDVSLQTIRAWLDANPGAASSVMNLNRSYVFFTVLEGEGPLGGEGLKLTPGRSLAIDRSKMPYGLPVWVDIDAPAADEPPLRRLMVAQDTGGAIRGAVRGDVFWGAGARAEHLAGQMKSQGRYWLLLPKKAQDLPKAE